MTEPATRAKLLTARRSYDADEVDAYIQRVRLGVARLKADKRAWEERAGAAEDALAERGEDRAGLVGRTLVGAQHALDEALAEARREADGIVAAARAEAHALVARAEDRARSILAEVSRRDLRDNDPADIWQPRPTDVADPYFSELKRSLSDVDPAVSELPTAHAATPREHRSRRGHRVAIGTSGFASTLTRRR